ncbi:MAG TPA: hypothetical protein PKY12_09145 [Catalimonadaceae bacterium]|nr:hypothetical protein [Catalimonadaceae bacterium]
MVIFFLSVCSNFSKGYAAILHEYIHGIIPVYFEDQNQLMSHSIMEPHLIVIKEEGYADIKAIVDRLIARFPAAILAIGHLPEKTNLNGQAKLKKVYSFAINEPEDVTMNHIMAKLVIQGVSFETHENPVLGEAFDLFKKYLQLNSNLAVCLSHVSHGETASQIGQRMSLSPRTIEDYIVKLKQIFGCHSKKELGLIYQRISNLSNALVLETVNQKNQV